MSNTIKYSEGSESLALNKGNWWIGTGDTNKGPTVDSGYWNAINPPDGGYTVYLNKETNGPSIHSITGDENLISFTNKISGQNYTTVAECLVYYQTQDDKLCVNREYENIVTDGLVLNLDAGYVPSYPTSGTTWYDLSGNGNDGTLINGPIYSGDSMVFDGVDDYGEFTFQYNTQYTVSFWIKFTGAINGARAIIDMGSGDPTIRIYLQNEKIKVDHTSGFASPGVLSSENVSINLWKNYIILADGTSISIYKNGILDNLGTVGNLPTTLLKPIGIANHPTGNSSFIQNLQCDISNVLIYNRVLTSQEVLQNYNAQKGRFGL